MPTQFRGEVIHVVGPDEQAAQDLTPELADLAADRYVLVCREGGTPSWGERLLAFLRREPIRPVTVVVDEPIESGAMVTATVTETAIAGVYEASDCRVTDAK